MPETSSRSTAGHLLSIIASGWAKLAITFLAGIFITILMIQEFGLLRFGMFIAIVQLTDLTVYAVLSALSRSMIRDLSTLRVRGDDARLRQVFSCGVVISFSLFAIVALLGLPLQEIGVRVLSYESDLHTDLRACIVSTAALAGLYVGISPWQALIISSKKIVQLNFFQVLNRLSDLVAIGVVLLAGFEAGFVAFVWLRAGLRACVLTCIALYGRSTTPAARFDRKSVNRKTLAQLFRTGGWAMGIPVSQFAFYEVDQLLLNIFAGPIYNAIYSVSNQVRGYARLAGSSIIQGTDALASDLQERGRLDSVRNVLDATIRFPLVITGCGAILLGVFAEQVLTIWLFDAIAAGMPEDGMAPAELIRITAGFATLMLVGTVIAEPHYTAASVLYGMGHLRRFSPVLIAFAITKIVVATVLLIQGFAPISVVGVTVALQFVLYGVYFPWLIADVSKRSVVQMIVGVYGRPVVSLLIFAGIAVSVRSAVEINSLLMLGVVLVGTGATYAPLGYFVALRPPERERLVGMVRGRLGRSRTGAPKPAPLQEPPLDGTEISSTTPR